MENHHAIQFGKPSISMGHLYHGYVSHNQRLTMLVIQLPSGNVARSSCSSRGGSLQIHGEIPKMGIQHSGQTNFKQLGSKKNCQTLNVISTFSLFNIAMDNGPILDDLFIESPDVSDPPAGI